MEFNAEINDKNYIISIIYIQSNKTYRIKITQSEKIIINGYYSFDNENQVFVFVYSILYNL